MKAPGFWYRPPGLASAVLSPLGWAYGAITARRLRNGKSPYRAAVPVLCVGNINAGGMGKTPTVQFLVDHLRSLGKSPVILIKGYRGSETGPVWVDPKVHTATQVGDEAILLSAHAPTVMAKDRVAGAKLAEEIAPDVIIMDDGFQSPQLIKDASIVVVDAQLGFGNGRCIPAGPLREPIPQGMARADVVLTIGENQAQDKFFQDYGKLTKPQIQGALRPLPTGMPWNGLPVLAFAGIGYPEKFFQTIRGLGAEVRRTVALGDHQPIAPALLQRLEQEAAASGARLVTTEKDVARMKPEDRNRVLPVPVRLALRDMAPLNALFSKIGLD